MERPEERIRGYLDSHGGTVRVPVHNLLTTWRLETLNAEGRDLIAAALAREGVRIDPELSADATEDDLVTLRSRAAPASPSARPQPPRPTLRGRVQRPAPPPRRAEPAPPEPAPAAEHKPSPVRRPSAPAAPPTPRRPKPGPLAWVRLQFRRFKLRRKLDTQLRAFGGILFEVYRVGGERPDLVRDRLTGLHQISGELVEVEDALGAAGSDAVCGRCGLYCGDASYCLACGNELRGPVFPYESGRRMSPPMVAVAVVLLTGAWLFGGIRGGDDPATESVGDAASNRQAAAVSGPRYRSVVAHVRDQGRIGIYRSARSTRPFTSLSNPNIDGAPLVFLIKKLGRRRAQVYLPMRPNGSIGWINLSKVTLKGHSYRVTVDLVRRRLTAFKGRRRIARHPVGVGRAVTPTPTGLYFITELLKQPDRSGIYGPWAFGLSAYSNVLNEFAGRDGILGIHGTNEPHLVGQRVSHGCIRVSNRAITRLAKTLPVGTPVRIVRG